MAILRTLDLRRKGQRWKMNELGWGFPEMDDFKTNSLEGSARPLTASVCAFR